jgi:hypothetical protein
LDSIVIPDGERSEPIRDQEHQDGSRLSLSLSRDDNKAQTKTAAGEAAFF